MQTTHSNGLNSVNADLGGGCHTDSSVSEKSLLILNCKPLERVLGSALIEVNSGLKFWNMDHLKNGGPFRIGIRRLRLFSTISQTAS